MTEESTFYENTTWFKVTLGKLSNKQHFYTSWKTGFMQLPIQKGQSYNFFTYIGLLKKNVLTNDINEWLGDQMVTGLNQALPGTNPNLIMVPLIPITYTAAQLHENMSKFFKYGFLKVLSRSYFQTSRSQPLP